MGRTFGYVFFFAALTTFALAQTNATTTVVPQTTPAAQPTSGAAPLPAPPEAALPGSGTPVGTAPSLDVNNASQGGQGAVVQQGVSDVRVGGQPMAPEPRQITPPTVAPENNTAAQEVAPAGNGNGSNSSSRYAVTFGSARQLSLGEIAAQNKNRKPLAKRTFDNNDVAALNDRAPNGLRTQSDDLPQGDQPMATPQHPANPNNALDQNDLRKVEDAVKRGQPKDEANKPK